MSKTVIVTGGTRGIGASISRRLKQNNFSVAANYAGNDEAAQKFSDETSIPVYKWNVADFNSCKEGIEKVQEELGPVTVLINNAGITRDKIFHRMSLENWTDVISTNLNSLFNMTRNVIEGMKENKFGRIINLSSINGQKGQIGQVNYCTAKSGIFGFTKALAQEVARYNITVNTIAPGYVNTEMVQKVPQEVLDKIVSTIPMQRLAEPDEIAECISFLSSEKASYITGATLSVNGGQYM